MTGIQITAVYRITCDGCGTPAEPDTEYRRYAEAVTARDRVSRFDGWLLRRQYTRPTEAGRPAIVVPQLWCPECVATGRCGTTGVTSNNPMGITPRSTP